MTTRYYNPHGKILDERGVKSAIRILMAYGVVEVVYSNCAGETVFHVSREKTTLGIYDLTTPAAGIRGSFQIVGEDNNIRLTQENLETILGTKLVEVRT